MPPAASVGALLRRGLAWNAGSVLSVQVLNFLRYAIVARLLPLDAFGLFAMANVAMLGALMMSNWGWRQAYIAQGQPDDEPGHRQQALWTADLVVRSGATLLLVLVAPVIAAGFDEPQLTPLLMVSALFVLGQGLRHPELLHREREMEFRTIAALELSGAVAGLLVAVVGAVVLKSAWALVLGQVVSSLLPAALSHLAIRAPVRLRFDAALISQGFRFGRNVFGISALGWVMSQADNAMIGAALGTAALGLFALAYRLCEIPKMVQDMAVSRAVYPYYVKALADSPWELGRAWTTTGRYSLWLSWFAYLPMLLTPELLLRILFGEPWVAAADALRVLAVAGLLRGANTFLAPVFLALKQPGRDLRIRIAEVATFLVVAAWGAWAAGTIEAVALAGVAAWGLGLVFRLWHACRETRMGFAAVTKRWATPLFALLICAALSVWLVTLPQWAALPLLLMVLSALFALFEWRDLAELRGPGT